MAHLKYQIILALALILCCTVPLGAATPLFSEQQARQAIDSLYKARTTIINKHLDRRKNQPVTTMDESDFRLFLSYLDGRILYYCEQLSAYGGSEPLKGTPCPVTAEGNLETTSYSPLPPEKSKTDREITAALDNELQAGFGSFDDMLLKEQEQIGAHVAKQREGSSYPNGPRAAGNKEGAYSDDKAGTGKNSSSDGKTGTGKKSTSSSTATGTEQTATRGSNNGGAGAGSNRQTRLPPTAGNKDLSQNDDDIVAKQLREAAEQETDPEVKARLWEEYRKYKEGSN